MSAHLAVLTFEGHRVRLAGTPEAPQWVAKDVCRVLHIHHTASGLRNAGVGDREKGVLIQHTPGGPQKLTTVTEPGLYRLILHSHKPQAEHFRTWIVRDVLPSIREHGVFPPPPPRALVDMRDPAQLAAAALQLTGMVRELEAQVAQNAPKVKSFERLQEARGDMSLSDAARWLGRQPRIFQALLEEAKILFRSGGVWLPFAYYREMGYFRVRRPEVDGIARPQTLVTPRGVQWLAQRYPKTDRTGEALRVREGGA